MGRHRNNPDRPAPDYNVGYRVPPQKGKFKPGQSGNPKGRPRKLLSFAEHLDAVMLERTAVTLNGKTRQVTFDELTALKLRAMAIAGNLRAIEMVKNRHANSALELSAALTVLTAEEEGILASYYERSSGAGSPPPAAAKPEGGDDEG